MNFAFLDELDVIEKKYDNIVNRIGLVNYKAEEAINKRYTFCHAVGFFMVKSAVDGGYLDSLHRQIINTYLSNHYSDYTCEQIVSMMNLTSYSGSSLKEKYSNEFYDLNNFWIRMLNYCTKYLNDGNVFSQDVVIPFSAFIIRKFQVIHGPRGKSDIDFINVFSNSIQTTTNKYPVFDDSDDEDYCDMEKTSETVDENGNRNVEFTIHIDLDKFF